MFRRLLNLAFRGHLERNLERELAFHITERTDELVRSGMSEKEAHLAAVRQFGNAVIHKERIRDVDINGWIESIIQDLQYGARMIRKSPVFALVVVLSLALAIGANVTLFSLTDAFLLRPLALDHVRDLVYFEWAARSRWFDLSSIGTDRRDPNTGETTSTSFPYTMVQRLQQSSRTLSDICSYSPLYQVTVSSDGTPDLIPGQIVSGNYFSTLRVTAAIGRTITEDDDRQASPVAVISYRFWQRRFGLKNEVLGKAITLNGVPLTIVGVTKPDFHGFQGFGSPIDISIPMAMRSLVGLAGTAGPKLDQPWVWWVRIVGRMKPDVTRSVVRSELESVFQSATQDSWNAAPAEIRGKSAVGAPPRLRVVPGARGVIVDMFDQPELLLIPLAIISAILLLIVCLNIANLVLARSAARRGELNLRLALGGGRLRLVRQLLTETLLLASIAGVLGICLAFWGKDLMTTVLPHSSTSSYDLRIDPPVLAFAIIISALVGLLLGIVPALRVTRENAGLALKECSRTLMGPRTRMGSLLLVVQMSLSTVLLVGAGMFLQTVRNLRKVDVGFDSSNLLLFRVNPRALKYDDTRIASFYEQLSSRLVTLPGVADATFSSYALVGNSGSYDRLDVDGRLSVSNRSLVGVLRIRQNFFRVFGVPILAGRDFTSSDTAGSPHVALINGTLAHAIFGNENPIGARVGFGGETSRLEIVGVVKDISIRVARDKVRPTIFLLDEQEIPGAVTFALRTTVEPTSLINEVREAVRLIDSNVPMFDTKTQNEQIEDGFAVEKTFAAATTFFGGVALLLASIGLYGLMSYSVERRTNEIGVRMAVGARRLDVVHLVMWQTFRLVFAGIIIGMTASYGVAKAMVTLPFLFQVGSNDPRVLGSVLVMMIAIACIAAYLPARRAVQVDPSIALKHE